MEESLSKFITAILAIIIMFIFPVYIAYEKKDDISYALAVRYTQEFVDKVRSKGYITRELYQDYMASLLTTGNTYDVELEHRYVRFDPSETSVDNGVVASRNEEIYSTEHILNFMDSNEEHKYVMNVNDNFNVKIKNTNTTMATVIYNIVTVNMSKNNVRIYVDYGGKVLADKWWGNIDFFPGGEDIDYRAIFSTIKVEAYTSLDYAKNGEDAIKSSEQVVLEGAEQAIYYKVIYSTKPESVTGKVYNKNSFWQDIGEAEYTDANGKYAIYKVTYGEENITTHAEFAISYTTKYGENVTKKASSPEFSIITPKVKAYASLNDARNAVNEILEGENVVSLEGTKDIYYRLDLSKEARMSGVRASVYRAGTIISNKTSVNIAESTDDYMIYKVSYTGLPTDENQKVITNNYAVFSFSLDGENMLTRNTVKFNFVYHNIRVTLPDNYVIRNNTINIVGYRGSEEVKTTFNNNGYTAVLKENDNNKTPSDVTLTITTENNEKNNGMIIKYTMTNTSSAKKTVKLAVHTDVYIDGDDHAYVYKEGDKKNVIKMVNRSKGTTFYATINNFDNKNNSSLNTLWVGNYSDRTNNLWNNSSNDKVTGTDSGFAFSWQGIEIPAGSSVERSFTVSLAQ